MVPTDSERAARSTGTPFADRRIRQYYDPAKELGRRAMQEAFEGCLSQAIEATPKDHPIHEMLADGSPDPDRPHVLWDAVLFYPPGIEWTAAMPRPPLWSKQIGFWGGEESDSTGEFYKNDCRQGPVVSDWHIEVREAMNMLLGGN